MTPRATAWPHIFFPRLFTAEEIGEIRNTTFRDVLAAVTYANSTDLQPRVFVWSQGECERQSTGSEQHR